MRKILLAALLLAGCTTTETIPVAVQTPKMQTPIVLPPQVEMKPVEIKVYNSAQLQELAKQQITNKEFAMFSMDADSYQNLAINMERLQRYLEQQRALIIELYRKDKIDNSETPATK